MKKIFIIFMLIAASSTISTECFAQSAYGQLQQTAGYSSSAANSYSGGSYDHEGARSTSGCGFDKDCGGSGTVDLSQSKTHTPSLLRNSDGSNPYAPKQYRSLKTTPPPMPR
ncbi:MAG: hypothetical protein ACD_20C00128G0018 [uncultured bacterium]|nr:MAG: hypothetical protein ACD_20C00128G0018 [uncultured bacterium]HBH19001.1 hypothetical protein [Cyanobacteria bacterium UBA9579]